MEEDLDEKVDYFEPREETSEEEDSDFYYWINI